MKFIADAMLGRLAKRMRLLGFDVLYDPSLDDNAVIRLSLEQDRMILTRDHGLVARPLASNHLLITGEHVRDQLDQFRSAYPVPLSPLTRCSRCNTPLVRASAIEVEDLVPPHVLRTRQAFFRCPGCGRTYWHGSHIAAMKKAGIAPERDLPAPP